jgi:hypothetical protein
MKRHLGLTLCHYFYVPALGDRRLDHHLPLCWRKDLDYWVDKQAEAKDAEIWDSAKIVGSGIRNRVLRWR